MEGEERSLLFHTQCRRHAVPGRAQRSPRFSEVISYRRDWEDRYFAREGHGCCATRWGRGQNRRTNSRLLACRIPATTAARTVSRAGRAARDAGRLPRVSEPGSRCRVILTRSYRPCWPPRPKPVLPAEPGIRRRSKGAMTPCGAVCWACSISGRAARPILDGLATVP